MMSLCVRGQRCINKWLCMMVVECRCHRQAQEGCWREEKRMGMVIYLHQRCKDLSLYCIPSLCRHLSPEMCQYVSQFLNLPGSGGCKGPAPVPPCTDSSCHSSKAHPSILSRCAPLCMQSVPAPSPAQVGHCPAPEDPCAWKVPLY